MTKKALFTGSFDPVTNGHLDIIERASYLFDHVYIGLFYNLEKQGYFSIECRKKMLEEAIRQFKNVSVLVAQDRLAADLAREVGAKYFVRGLRNSQDFDYEANLEFFNKQLADDIETVYLSTSPSLSPISSSRIRELIHFKASVKPFVPKSVVREVEKMSEE
ncbi:pantetheine-phosphate adenylyltransferase [Streptococcus agalactiae]|nr:phosphopantetheine adenylyltransferase [Streptococcus agalactiae 138P]AHX74613.1 phosphopantetheine adenylyltransferase [Streptococcus agalactiae]AKU01391.1 phosphopantetheine adenylyltransferase [Streptococcus agalactiae]AWQ28963.1 pantetheine-phosphate adenylyltransferase [Streptococcus agalactiae]OVF14980.1 pantetheine-phosphate adenylyltransferase [Streptococcus agalactiae]